MTTKLYTPEEASKIIRLGRTKLYEELNSGRLKAFKVGKSTLISETHIQEWMEALPAYKVE